MKKFDAFHKYPNKKQVSRNQLLDSMRSSNSSNWFSQEQKVKPEDQTKNPFLFTGGMTIHDGIMVNKSRVGYDIQKDIFKKQHSKKLK